MSRGESLLPRQQARGVLDSSVQTAAYFDHVYRDNDRFWWRDGDRYARHAEAYPLSLLTQMLLRAIRDRPPGRALDLGAGEGTDSIRLALLGYQVDAVEISPVAATKIARFADEADVAVNVVVADISHFDPPGEYDVVICNGVLHYVENKEPVVASMQAATKRDGLNVVSLWSSHTTVPACHEIVPVFCDDEQGIVTKLYEPWHSEFLYFERDKPETAHADMPKHSHSHIKLIARNPRGLGSRISVPADPRVAAGG